MAKAKTPTKYIVRPIQASKPGMTRVAVRVATKRRHLITDDLPAVLGRPLPWGAIELSGAVHPTTGKPETHVEFLNYKKGDFVAIMANPVWDDPQDEGLGWFWGKVIGYSSAGMCVRLAWGTPEAHTFLGRPVTLPDDTIRQVCTREQWEAREDRGVLEGWNACPNVVTPWDY